MDKSRISTVLILLALTGLLAAAPARVATFVEALATAKDSGRPVAVYVHGSSWHPASRLFLEKIWNTAEFDTALKQEVVLTEIDIRQNLPAEEAKAAAEAFKGWDAKAVRTYPALQVYAADGLLLKTWQGREFRLINSPDTLAAEIDALASAAARRAELLQQITGARQASDTDQEALLLIQLVELPVNHGKDIVEQLKKADPKDSSGWQARLSFQNWEFVRHITALVNESKTDEALAEVDQLLGTSHHSPDQRALLLGARGRALVAKGDLEEAWHAFEEAQRTDPDGPNGRAVWRYGIRVAGVPLRVALPPESSLHGLDLGENLTRDHATFTMSSASSDNPDQHSSLFKGPYAPGGFAFHTNQEKDAHIIIDLQALCSVSALRITNRTGQQERATGLTLWTSADGAAWEEAWTAPEVAAAWDVLLPQPVTARFLKLGLHRGSPEFLHLRAVDVFGSRPE